MLKARVITATLFILFVVLCLFFLPPTGFALVSGIFFLYAIWEWTRLAGFTSKISRILCVVLIPLGVFATLCLLQWLERGILFELLPALTLIFWILVPLFLYYFPSRAAWWKSQSVGLIAGLFVLVPSWIALNYLRNIDPMPVWVLYVMVLVWVADIAAFFAGRRFGKHKLAPAVSPGKSWEGVAGALIATLFLASVGYFLLNPLLSIGYWLMLNLLTVLFSIVGDLFESAFKRVRNLKDSGSILPGHGGLLDRMDSLTAALPIFAIGLMI
jgi:phosphatidate cytidylyltransferase